MDRRKPGLYDQSRPAARDESADELIPAFSPVLTTGFECVPNLPREATVASGHEILRQGESADSVQLVCRGLVKLIYVNPKGQQVALALRSTGWYAGAVSAVLGTPNIYSARAVTTCAVIRIPLEEFSLRLAQNADLRSHFMTRLCQEMASQMRAQAQMMSGTADERLRDFMDERTATHSRWAILDPLPMLKQTEMAQLLSISPEHLSRLLRKGRQRKELPRTPHAGSHKGSRKQTH